MSETSELIDRLIERAEERVWHFLRRHEEALVCHHGDGHRQKERVMDERKQCQKCGHGWVSTRYIKAVDQLKNECTCGYSWWEPTYEQRTQRATTERREQS